MEDAVESYTKACNFLKLNSAHLVGNNVYSTWSQEVPSTGRKVFISKVFSEAGELDSREVVEPGSGMLCYSKDRSLKAHLYNWNETSFLDVWDRNGLYRQLALTHKICGILSKKLQKLALFKY